MDSAHPSRWSNLACLLLLMTPLPAPARAQPTAAEPLSLVQRSRSETLPNGLRVLLIEDRAVPLLSLQLWLRVGSALDPPARPGWAETMRRVLQDGGEPPAAELAGARCASETLPDAIYWALVVPASRDLRPAEAGLRRLAEVLRGSGVTVDALRRAGAETLRFADGVSAQEQQLRQRILQGHGYGHLPAFATPLLLEASLDDASEFLERWCVTGNAQLVLAGDLDVARGRDLVARAFEHLPRREPPRRAYHELPAEAGWLRDPAGANASGGLWRMQWVTPGLGAADNYALDVLAHYLFNPVDGLAWQEDSGLGHAHWRRTAWDQAGILEVDVVSQQSDLSARVERLLAQVADQVPAQKRLFRARQMALADLRYRQADFLTRTWDDARYEVIGGDVLLADLAAAQLERLPAGALREAAHYLLRARRAITRCDAAQFADSPSPWPPFSVPRASPRGALPEFSLPARQAVERYQLRDGSVLRILTLQDAQAFEIGSIAACGAPASAEPGLPPSFQQDYLTSRGMRVRNGPDGLRLFAISRQAPSAIELFSRMRGSREDAERGQITLAIAGGVTLADIRAAVDAYWSRSPSAPSAATAPAASSAPGALTVNWHEGAKLARLRIGLDGRSLLQTADGYFVLHAIAADLLSRLPDAAWALRVREGELALSAALNLDSVRAAVSCVTELRGRLEQPLGPAQAGRLASLARLHIWLGLTSPSAICDALLSGVDDPWNCVAPVDWEQRMKQAWSTLPVALDVFGGGEEARMFVGSLGGTP